MEKELNVELDTTKFVNIDTEPFDIYINGKLARHLDAGEQQEIPVWVAQVGAKHLVDKVVQRPPAQGGKYGIVTLAKENPVRRSLMAEILPNLAEKIDLKPLSPQEMQDELQKEIRKQTEVIRDLTEQQKAKEKIRDEEITSLKKQVAELTLAMKNKLENKTNKSLKELDEEIDK